MRDVELISGVGASLEIVHEWNELAENAVEKNIFFEPCLVVPAMRWLDRRKTSLLLFRDSGKLVGIFPLQRKFRWHGLPLPHYSFWRYPHCYLTTPLIHETRAQQTVERFTDWVARRSKLLFSFEFITASGPFFDLLSHSLANRDSLFRHATQYGRASFEVKGSFGEYWAGLGSRKNLKKKLARLEHRGEILVERLMCEAHLPQWTEDFLQLERKGWKGREGTALACSIADTGFFRESLQRAFAEKKLLFQRLCLSGRPIAMKCTLVAGGQGFCFKIAYDDEYKECSPGLLLEVETLRYLLDQQSEIRALDSCAAPNAPLFEHLWREQRMVTSGEILGNWIQQALKAEQALRRVLSGSAPLVAEAVKPSEGGLADRLDDAVGPVQSAPKSLQV